MRRAIILILLLAVIFATRLYPAAEFTQFNKGVTYILIKDKVLALQYMEEFFKYYSDPGLRSIFISLIEDNSWEVTKQFNSYLDNNHRSTPALVGIALSTTDMKDSTSMNNLQRAIGLTPNFAATYLCMGMEYQKIKNYPMAKLNYQKAIRLSGEPEFKIPLSQLHLLLNEPGEVLKLLKPEADRLPDNFYFNFCTAEAFYRLKDLNQMGRYIEAAIEINPANNDAQLLMAKYLLSRNELKEAKAVLKKIQYNQYNKDYLQTFGHVLLLSKDKQAKAYLDEVYSKEKWDKDINWLQGLYYITNQDKGNIQNWITRAILSGSDVKHMRELFPGTYQFPQYPSSPFFDVTSIHWLSNELLLVSAVKQSGDRERLYIFHANDLKLLKALEYQGKFKDIFFSRDRKRMVFSTDAGEGNEVYLYALDNTGKDFVLRSLYNRPIKMNSIVAGFNNAGNLAYITHSDIYAKAFDSPFSIVSQTGEKKTVYPDYPYPVYKYNFATSTFSVVTDIVQLENVPIDCVKRYFLVYNAMENNSNVRTLIENGQRLDLTSSEVVKIVFSKDSSSFIIYLSDLKNAFQALLVDNTDNHTYKIDETMFLGEGKYAELDVLDFDPEKKEIVVITKGNDRTIIRFNYRSYLYTRLAEKMRQFSYDKTNRIIYILTERSKKKFFTETNLSVVYLRPFYKKIIDERRTLNRIIGIQNDKVYFTTLDGEMLELNGEHQFYYSGPSFFGSMHEVSIAAKKTAAFINGNLFVVNINDSSNQWASKQNSKK